MGYKLYMGVGVPGYKRTSSWMESEPVCVPIMSHVT